jgi:hypothetical protein
MTDPMAADACEHHYETRILGGHPITVRACVYCRTPDWPDLHEQAENLFRWGRDEALAGKPAREHLSAYDMPTEQAGRTTLDNPVASGGPSDNPLRQLLADAIGGVLDEHPEHNTDGEHQHVVGLAVDAVLTAIEDHLDIGDAEAWCKSCRRVWEGKQHRCESDAERSVTQVGDLYARWVKAGPPPLGTPMSRWWDRRLAELHDAIRPPGPTAAEATEHPRTEAQMEREIAGRVAITDQACGEEQQ